MKLKALRLIIIVFTATLTLTLFGCNTVSEDEVHQEGYLPQLETAIVKLSTGEELSSPDMKLSDSGFDKTLNEGHIYNGILIWTVEESDVFELESVRLSFTVNHLDNKGTIIEEMQYVFIVEGIELKQSDSGVQYVIVDQVEVYQRFEVAIDTLYIGKDQPGSGDENVDYIGFEMEMSVLD